MANHANGSDRYEYLYETDDVKRRCEMIALYMIETGATVRSAAAKFGISKSTVHKDVTERLERCAPALFRLVREILEENKAKRAPAGRRGDEKKIFGKKKGGTVEKGNKR